MSIRNASGVEVDPNAYHVGLLNPFRYRGYRYDADTGFYYLQSRYYDPVIGRFINADKFTSTGQSFLGHNMFAYCGNNPVNREDSSGIFWDTVFDAISLVGSVIDVIRDPSDVMAWVGVAADVASLLIPFATGGGALVKIFTKADDIVDAAEAVDDAVDTAKAVNNTLEKIKKAATSLPQGNNTVYISYGKKGAVEYVGITNNFKRRSNEWKGVRDIIEFVPGLDRTSARFIEQAVIDSFGMAKNGGTLSNLINSIGKGTKRYADYLEFARKHLN